MREYMTDGRISLRKYRIGDEVALHEAVNESIEALSQWGFYNLGFTFEDARHDVAGRISSWDQGTAYTFVIEELPGRVFVGNCRVEKIELPLRRVGLGWWVRASKTGKGIATAAARLVAQAAFEDLKLDTVIVYTNARNMASRRVAEKLGATLVQIRREDKGVDCAVHKLKPEQLRP